MNKKEKKQLRKELIEEKIAKKTSALAEARGALPPKEEKATSLNEGVLLVVSCPHCENMVGQEEVLYGERGAGEFSGASHLKIIANCPFCGQAIIFRN